MVYTVTMNPSIDYVVGLEKFELGKLHRTKEEAHYIGGKGINVSTVLNQFNIPTIAMGFVAGFTGDEIIHKLKSMGISSDFIKIKRGVSRINIKMKTDQMVETEINGHGPEICQKDIQKLYQKLSVMNANDILVLSGSAPKGTEITTMIYARICEFLKNKKIKVIIDAEGDLLVNTLRFEPFLIKPNQEELGRIFDKCLKTETEIIECAKKMQEIGARNVLVSRAKEGAILICQNGEVLKQRAPYGKVINSVGAGDSMVAGFIARILEYENLDLTKKDYQEALRFSVATGSAAAFSHTYPTKSEIEVVLKQLEELT